jgi:hypothetical protein
MNDVYYTSKRHRVVAETNRIGQKKLREMCNKQYENYMAGFLPYHNYEVGPKEKAYANLFNGGRHTPIQSVTNKKEGKVMSIRVTKPVFINGVPADSVSIDELLSLISKSQARVTELKAMELKSKTVDAIVASEEKGVAAALVELDTRKVSD